MSSARGRSSFFDDLGWLTCNSCLEVCTEEKKFLLTTCEDSVVCLKCAHKLRSESNPRKIRCRDCKKDVGVILINENMPEDKLVYFMDVDTLYAKLHEHLELEEDERAAELKEMGDELKHLKNQLRHVQHKSVYYDDMLKKESAKVKEGEYEHYRDMLLNIMTEDQIETLTDMDTDQLKRMNYDQMMAASERPLPASIISSTPYGIRENVDATGSSAANQFDAPFGHSMDMRGDAIALPQHYRSSTSRLLSYQPQEIPVRRHSREHSRRNSNDRRRPSKEGSHEHSRRNSNDRRLLFH